MLVPEFNGYPQKRFRLLHEVLDPELRIVAVIEDNRVDKEVLVPTSRRYVLD